MSHEIYDLKLHEVATLSLANKRAVDSYIIVRVHGGWIYTNLDRNIATFVPYTVSTDGSLDNLGQIGNRENPDYLSGKSTEDVAESERFSQVREYATNLTDEQKMELVRILSERGH